MKTEMVKILHPKAVFDIKINDYSVPKDILYQTLMFVSFYFAIIAISAFLLAIVEKNTVTAITGADVVMLLRIQTERLNGEETEMAKNYSAKYCLTPERLEKYAPNAILMHPGPVNRDIEISSELLDSPRGKTILEQAQNGVYIRMAVLENAAG